MSALTSTLGFVLFIVASGSTISASMFVQRRRLHRGNYQQMLENFLKAIRSRSLAEIQMERRYILLARDAIEEEMQIAFGQEFGRVSVGDMLSVLRAAEFETERVEPEECGLRPGFRPFIEQLLQSQHPYPKGQNAAEWPTRGESVSSARNSSASNSAISR
jgi:hypothetical protein